MILRGKEAVELWVRLQRSNTHPITFTNGCFDILSVGHVKYLAWLRDQAPQNKIIVAINDDKSVNRLKGGRRPYNTLDDRLTVLNALRDVDAVTWFEQDNPLELIQEIKPDILAKGGDYKAHEIVGYGFVTSYNGQVLTTPLWAGYSTTALVDKIKDEIDDDRRDIEYPMPGDET